MMNGEMERIWLATANSELRSEVLALKQENERLEAENWTLAQDLFFMGAEVNKFAGENYEQYCEIQRLAATERALADDLRAERAINIHAGPVLGPLKAENERLLALIDSVLACDGADRTMHITVEIPFDLYHALEEARRER